MRKQKPRLNKIPKFNKETGDITSSGHVYHPTKGWRRIWRDPSKGRLMQSKFWLRIGVII